MLQFSYCSMCNIILVDIPPDPVVVIIERKDYCLYILTIYFHAVANNNNKTLHASSFYTRCT